MSVEFTIDELKHLYDNFKKYDRNSDRQLSRKEILCLVQEEILNATENEVDWFLAMIDVKVNDKSTIAINFAQYVRGMSEFAKIGSRIQFPSSSGIKNLIESGLLTLDLTGKKKGLNWKEVDRVYNQFERADKNNSGTLSYPEMVAVFRKVTPDVPYENYSEVYNKIDTNKSGFVDFLEFLRWVIEAKITISLGNHYSKAAIAVKKHKKLEREKSKQSLKLVKLRSSSYALNQVQKPVETTKEMRADAFKAFAAMDANADGELSETEFCKALGQVFKSLTKSELGRLYFIVDSDRSGSISFDEFLYAVAHETQVTKMAETMKHSYYASKFDWEIPFEELKIDAKIGEGNFGVVYKGTWHGTPVAIKKLKSQSIDDDVLEEFKKEVAILAKLRHPNIVLFMGACTQPDNMCIVTEYLSEGNVYSLLHKRNKKLAPQAIQKIAHQVALGLNYLHKHNIVHRDLKSLNLLMDDNQVCKVCDFGLSCLKPSDSCLTEQVGSPLWMSPELLICKPYSEKVDVYSYAICVWECLTNKLPFDNLTFSQLVKSVSIMGLRPEIPSSCNPKLAALLKKCWESNPDMRPSVDDIIASLKEIS